MAKKEENKEANSDVSIEALQGKITALESTNKQLTSENTKLKTDSLAKINELTVQNEALELEKETLEALNSDLTSEKSKLNEELVSLKKPAKPALTKEEYLKTRSTIIVNEQRYAFSFDAPKTLSIKGVPKKTSELIKDKKAMEELIVGRAPFVESVK
ncbi:hypothetical protein SAMN04489761_3051 [Tenacibaculum sp. MAR_2009_124]|uniref:hypothetical protein n=1 Tax=Tenacibaculum sp. MAR_2009_124 TaxID=1250059 RepID=UPI00089C2591|nr:hypothetical protein [Tenacibaculum sp. MAR_2009_124]SEC45895.1 hypothetical protein SAMN04489761_3051 [Tenacibaculum sp. MAR_2009_124]